MLSNEPLLRKTSWCGPCTKKFGNRVFRTAFI